jgi:GAF domain-containing protein
MTSEKLTREPGTEAWEGLGLSTVARYTIGGFLFGISFPLGATIIDMALRGLPPTIESARAVQAAQPLHLIIDTAPLVMAAAGWLAGVRQGRAEEVSAELEARVSERTAELAANTARLQAVAEVGGFITRARDMDSLLKDVVNLIVERFDFYHAQVFLIEETGHFAVLRASTGEAGQELLARGHRLAVASRSVIGDVTAHGEPVIALDTDADTVHRRNELLPHTRSEMALPLKIGERILGALDVQSVSADAFTAEDIPVFQTMADQLAVAIDNVRLFEEAQQNLRDIEALNRQLTGEAWRDFVAGHALDEPLGYHADERGLHPVDGTAASEGDMPEDMTSLPIVVRGQTIGSLDVGPKEGEALDEEMQAVLEAVAERVALALDNTRLSQQAQRTAQAQQLINVFSEKLQRAPDVRAILRLVAVEVSRIMGAPRGFTQLETRGETEAGVQR